MPTQLIMKPVPKGVTGKEIHLYLKTLGISVEKIFIPKAGEDSWKEYAFITIREEQIADFMEKLNGAVTDFGTGCEHVTVSVAHRIENPVKLFISNVPYSMNSEDLLINLGLRESDVLGVRISTDPDGRSRGFGSVVLSAIRAKELKERKVVIEGRTIRIIDFIKKEARDESEE